MYLDISARIIPELVYTGIALLSVHATRSSNNVSKHLSSFPNHSKTSMTYACFGFTYLCFISLLYLDLYVLGDDALIS